MKKVIVLLLSVMLVFGICACGSDSSDSADSGTTVEETSDASADLTAEQKNAYEQGLKYLDSLAFSKQGLIDQLEYEEYSTDDAKAAVKAIEENGEVDWNEEAYEAAKGYLDSQNFSKDGLISQLESEYGSKFTHDQAEYGADKAYDEQ